MMERPREDEGIEDGLGWMAFQRYKSTEGMFTVHWDWLDLSDEERQYWIDLAKADDHA